MGYHSNSDVYYDDFTKRTCEICDSHSNKLNKASHKKLQDQIDILKKQKNIQSSNYNLCNEDKKDLSISLANCESRLQTELDKLQSQIEVLEAKLNQANSLLTVKTQKIKNCEDDRGNLVTKAATLTTDLEECNSKYVKNHDILQAMLSEKSELEKDKQKISLELNSTKAQIAICEKDKQKLNKRVEEKEKGLERLQDDYDKISQEKQRLQTEYNDILENNIELKKELSLCQDNLGKGCEEAKAELSRLQAKLDNNTDLLNNCRSNLTKITIERDSLSKKESDLKLCKTDLNSIKVEKDECKDELRKLTDQSTAYTEQIRNLTQKNYEQASQILNLKEQNSALDARNQTLTTSFNVCTKSLTDSKKLILEKSNEIDDLETKVERLDKEKDSINNLYNVCKTSLSIADKKILDVYKSVCNEMHERYQNYYDGATKHKSFFDKLIDHFISTWFSNRYTDTKPIWEESSLKQLICGWQYEGIIRNEATIRAGDERDSENVYQLKQLCTNKDLIEKFDQDIINPCNDENGIWNYDFILHH